MSNNTSKKPKLSPENEITTVKDGSIQNFEHFVIDEVLSENSQTKMMCVCGHFSGPNDDQVPVDDDNPREKEAVVIMEKTHFTEDIARKTLTKDTGVLNTLQNDIYGTYSLHPAPCLNGR